MSDVVDQINARLADMEAAAKAATTGEWAVTEATGGGQAERRALGTFALLHNGTQEVAIVRGFSADREADAAHIALNDPATVLRWVAGLRVVVELHTEGDYGCAVCCSDWGEAMTGDNAQAEPWPCPTIEAIAAMWPTPDLRQTP